MQIRDPQRVARRYPHELSGGMGQRVMIAMMLAPDPELLIADEPTSALDATVQAEILRLIEDLVSRRGMGLILISHDLPLVSHFCDRVVVMYAGRVVEELAASELTRAQPSLYARPARMPAGAQPSAASSDRHAARSVMAGGMIEVAGLRVRFGDIEAVKAVSFSVARGDSFGLVGESGSGKSTVLRALAGLNHDWTGRMIARRRDARRRVAARNSTAACRWCSRIRTARCIRARPSIGCSASRCWCIGMDNIERRIMRGAERGGAAGRRCASAIRTSCPAASASAWRSRAR